MRFQCIGGPWHGQYLWLCTRATNVLKVRVWDSSYQMARPWHGRYVVTSKGMNWENA